MNIFIIITFSSIFAVNMQNIHANKDNSSLLIESQFNHPKSKFNIGSEIREKDDESFHNKSINICENSFKKISIKKVLLVDYDNFFTNITEINDHCLLGNQVYKQLKQYTSNCLSGVSRQLSSLFLRGIKRLIKTICYSQKTKEDVLRIFQCSENTALAGWKICANTANRQFFFIGHNSSEENLFRDSCCMYDLFNKCVDNKMKSIKNCQSSKTVNVLFKEMVDIIFKDLMSFVCSNWDNENCKKKNSETLDLLKSIERQDFEVRDLFLLGPLINIMSSLSSI